jgi:hypothetical protein
MLSTSQQNQNHLTREYWGPRFWKVLHTMAECVGRQPTPVQANDEADAWMFLIKAQPFVMPCTLCKKHFLEFLNIKPFGNLRTIQGDARKAWIQKWIWDCHRRVNERNQKHTPPLEDLSLLYPKQSLSAEIKDILIMFQTAHSMQQLKPEDTNRWRHQLARLRILYGI